MKLHKLTSTINLEHSAWLEERKKGIGGSDAGAICGLNPYSTAITVYMDKLGLSTPVTDNEAMRQGRDLEEYVASRFTEETGMKVRRANAIYFNPEHPFMLANVDRLLVGQNAGLECKTASAYSADKWAEGKIPAHYEIQCHHYMAVTGADAWYIACVILGKGFVYQKIDRDEEIISNLVQIEKEFWYKNVLPKKMPSPDGSKAADGIISQYYKTAEEGSVVPLPETAQSALERRLEVMQLIDRLEKEKAEIEQNIKLYMKDTETLEGNKFRVSWKNCVSERIDSKKLKMKFPSVYKECCKKSTSRRFLVKELKEDF